MDKFTPGPWVLGLSADNKIHCVDAIDPVDGRKFEVCEVLGIDCDKIETEVSRANARLIAAAPELLDALEELKCELILSDVDMDYIDSHFGKALNKARAAISRAKGESK